MEVTKEDIEQFSKKINAGPLLNSIRTDGNCFFQTLEYAAHQKLSKTSKTIELRQKIVSTMNKPIISGVPYDTFMYGTLDSTKLDGTKLDDTLHGAQWPYAELDVVIAASKYMKRSILIISVGENGGVTMIRNKSLGNPIFLICDHAIHYIPFQKGIKLTDKMKQMLKEFEKTKIVEHIDGAVITTFLLSDMDVKPINVKPIIVKRIKDKSINVKAINVKAINVKAVNVKAINVKAVNVKAVNVKPVNSLILTRKKLKRITKG